MSLFVKHKYIREKIFNNYINNVNETFSEILKNISADDFFYCDTLPENPNFSQWQLGNWNELKEFIDEIYLHIDTDRTMDVKLSNTKEGFLYMTGTNPNPFRIMYPSFGEHQLTHMQDSFEINLMLCGSCTIQFRDHKLELKQGQLCIIAPDTLHTLHINSNESCLIGLNLYKNTFRKVFNQMTFGTSILSNFLENSLSDKNKGYLHMHLPLNNDVCLCLRNLLSEYYSNKPYAIEMCVSYIELILMKSVRESISSFKYGKADYNNTLKQQDATMNILQYIHDHYTSLTLNDLAAKFHYSPNHLGVKIKEATGQSYTEIVSDLKLKKATQLLLSTDLSIENISMQCGYGDLIQFSRSFKKKMNISPLKYRKQHS